MMRRKIWGASIVGAMLIGAGLIASAVSSPGTASAQEDSDESQDSGPVSRALGFLDEVLDDLVGDGTITQDQADAIVAASEAKIAELREEMQANRRLLEDMLADGVITEDEASELPEDHFLLDDRFDEAWEDGQLDSDDLRAWRREHRAPGSWFGRGFRFGALLDDGGIDQDEYDSLADGHPLKQVDVTEFLEDGLITPEELRELKPELRSTRPDEDT